MFVLRLSLLLLFNTLLLFESIKPVASNKPRSNQILFVVSNDANAGIRAYEIETPVTTSGKQLSKTKSTKRTLASLLFAPRPLLSPIAPASYAPQQDPIMYENEVNRVFLNAFLTALQATDEPAEIHVTENQEDDTTGLRSDENAIIPMATNNRTREFVIGLLQGVRATAKPKNMRNAAQNKIV